MVPVNKDSPCTTLDDRTASHSFQYYSTDKWSLRPRTDYLTFRPRGRMDYESIAHEAVG